MADKVPEAAKVCTRVLKKLDALKRRHSAGATSYVRQP
jgi:hypothetical protein